MIIILVTAAAVITAGAYLHWAVAPVTAAYRVGAVCGRMAQAAGRPWTCPVCGREFVTSTALDRHVASEHGGGR